MKYSKEDICKMIVLGFRDGNVAWERPVAQELYNEFWKLEQEIETLKRDKEIIYEAARQAALDSQSHIDILKKRVQQLTIDNMTLEYLESERQYYGEPEKDITPSATKDTHVKDSDYSDDKLW